MVVPQESLRDYALQTWLNSDGLPHNVVNRVRQDATGYLWFGTAAGLARYDGFEFETFPLPPNLTEGGYNIRDLAIGDRDTVLIVPPRGGVLQYRDGKFSQHPISQHVVGKVADIFIEPSGIIWLGTHEGVLMRWEAGRVTIYGKANGISRRGLGFFFARDGSGRTWVSACDFLGYFEDGKLTRFPHPPGAMLQIAPSRDGGLWLIGDGRLLKFSNGQVRTLCASPPWLALKTSVRCLLEDRAGVLWLGTARHGLFRYGDGKIEAVAYAHQGIQSIEEDHEGSLWFATDGGGVGRLRPKAFRLYDHQAGLPESLSTSVSTDETGDVWFANRAGGLVRKHGDELRAFQYSNGHDPIFVSSICPDHAGHLWIGTTIGIYRVSIGNPTKLEKIESPMRNPRVLFCRRNGDIWAGDSGDLFGYFRGETFTEISKKSGFLGNGITAIAEDGAGDVWCGSATGELYRWRDGTMARFDAKDGLPSSPIHALHPDANGDLWIGTLGGLVLRNANGFHRYTRAEGLPAGMILQIQEDDAHRLWLGSSSGYYHVEKRELTALAQGGRSRAHVVSHGKDEGLPGISPTTDYQPSTWKDKEGRLWFTTYRGVLAFDPARFVPNSKPPAVLLKEVLLDDQTLSDFDHLRIPPGAHHLEFGFAALSYAAPALVRLRHRLEGIDPHWVETGSTRSARYSNLAPGHYRLRVIACNGDGVWNQEGATLDFAMQAAWWQTGWFDAGSLFAFTGLVVCGARFWTQRRLNRQLEILARQHALEKERGRIARDLHDELGASLTGIGMLVNRLKASPSQSNLLIDQLAASTKRIASDLERVVWTVSPRNNTLDRLAAFIGRFAQDFLRDTSVICLVHCRRKIPPIDLAPDVRASPARHRQGSHQQCTQAFVRLGGRDQDLFRRWSI